MRLQGGGSQDFNQLISDAAQFRNNDFASSQGLAYMGVTSMVATPTFISIVQIFNPAGSGKTVIVDGILVSNTTTGAIALFFYDAALASLTGVWKNMLRAGAASNTEMRKQAIGGALGTDFAAVENLANSNFLIPFEYPAILEPGEGIIASQGVVNTTMSATFWGREV